MGSRVRHIGPARHRARIAVPFEASVLASPLLIILNFWIEGWDYWVRSLTISAGPLSLAMFLLYPIIAAILLKKQVRGAFAFAALGIFFAAVAVALTLYHQTETGRVMMLRAARAVLG